MFGWGVADIFAARCSRKIGPVLTLFWSEVLGFLAALAYFISDFSYLDISRSFKYLWILAPASVLFMIGSSAYNKGFVKGQASLVSPLGSSYVIIVVVLSIFIFKETLKISQLSAIILIILGIFLISLDLKRLNVFGGTKEGLLAMLGWGLPMFVIAFLARTMGWLLPVLFTKFFIIAGLAIFMFFKKRSFMVRPEPLILTELFSVGFLNTAGFFFYSFGVAKEYASIVAPIAASYPLITVILARIFLRERLAASQVAGIAAVIVGLILISI